MLELNLGARFFKNFNWDFNLDVLHGCLTIYVQVRSRSKLGVIIKGWFSIFLFFYTHTDTTRSRVSLMEKPTREKTLP